jgi:hypothetical protein
MWVPRRIEQFLETINTRLGAIQEALRDQISTQERTHAADRNAHNEARRQRTWRRIEEQRIKKRADRESESDAQTKFQKTYRQQIVLNVLTFLAFLSAVVYAGIAVRQWQEMIRATNAAEQSAITADRTLNESAWQYRKSLHELQLQTRAAQTSAQTAQDALNVQNRPWLSAEASLGDSLSNGGGLVFDRDGNLSINITIKGKNFGKSIAQDIRFYGGIFASRSGNPWLKVPEWQREICDHPKVLTLGPHDKTPFFQAFDKFPDETYEYGLGVSMGKDDVIKQSLFYTDDPARHRYISRFYFVGCVDYASSFEAKRHQTRFAYDLLKKEKPLLKDDPDAMRGYLQFEVGSSVPKDMLWLAPSLEGPTKAN